MSSEMTKLRWLIVAIVWCVIIGLGVLAYVKLWKPEQDKKEQQKAEEHKKEVLASTGSQSRYNHEINFAIDSFSGYAGFRCNEFRDECAKRGIKVNFIDDGADYDARIRSFQDGKVQMGVYTVDALVKSSYNLKDLPATIVALVDETKGADAAVGGTAFPNIDAINDPDVRFVCVPNSPSETLARVLMAYYNLPNLPPNPFEFVNSVDEVYAKYRKSAANEKKVFITWEPYVSKILENPDYRNVIDSSKFRGQIFDVLACQRDYLLKNEAVVTEVVKAYLSTIYNRRNTMVELVSNDARSLGQPLKPEQAERLSQTIWWKNTQETFGHYGLTSGHGLQHIEEVIINVTDVLIKTKGIDSDPTGGRPNLLYYDGIIRKIFSESWHPGFAKESVRQENSLAVLSEAEWKNLRPVGTLNVARLVFSRGSSRMSDGNETILKDLTEKLKNWPQFYLVVRGNCVKSPDPDIQQANVALAKDRAQATVDWLIRNGVDRNRIRAETSDPNGSTTVAFILGELPY